MRQAWLVTAFVVLAGCADSDADGTRDAKDCAPDDSHIHPGAQEVCDGVDNDCNGQVDEDVALTVFWDRDLDGYGDPGFARRVCEMPVDGSLTAGDCDDLDPKKNPDAVELCNLADDDCDGDVDEDVLLTFYVDADRDGHGVAGDTTQACFAPDGYTGQADDCDDGDPLAWTDAPELCDGADNDCDGGVDEDLEPVRVWVDGDLDGYGDPAQPTAACGSAPGLADNDLDCDDTDPARSPDAIESRGNGFDEDCDGYVDEFGVGPGNEFSTVEDALGTAPDGSVIQLDQGLTVATVDLTGHDVTLAGEGCARTTLYADANGTAITADAGTIERMTVSGGSGTLIGSPGATYGGGVLVTGDVHLDNLCLDGNSADRGGAVAVMAGTATIDQVLMVRNSVHSYGGGVYVDLAGTADIWASRIVGNTSQSNGGGIQVEGGTAWVSNTVIAGNLCGSRGCGVGTAPLQDELGDWHSPVLDLDQVTLHANASTVAAIGQAVYGESATLTMHDVLITGHPVVNTLIDSAKGADLFTPVLTTSFVGFRGNAGTDIAYEGWLYDRIGDDVRYVNDDPTLPADQWDLHLLRGSGFVDDGDPAMLDPDGTVADLGAYGGPNAPDDWDFGFVTDDDADGMLDAWELWRGGNLAIDDSADDDDADGLTNLEEFQADTDPFDADTDLDGVSDPIELADGTAPTDARDHAPTPVLAAERWALLGEPVWLDAGASTDPNGDGLSFGWAVTERPPLSVANPSDPAAPGTDFIPDVAGDYTVEVTVDDGAATRVGAVVVHVYAALIVPDDFPTLQAAVSGAVYGEAIAVRPGVWKGTVQTTQSLTVFGLVGPGSAADVVIDGGGLDSTIRADAPSVTLAQLTLTGGWGDGGGGLHAEATGPVTLVDVIVRDNHAVNGGGLWVSGALSTVTLRDVRVLDNVASANGGGIWYFGDSVHDAFVAERDTFAGNRAANEGGALYLDGGTTSGTDANFALYGCSFLDNEAAVGAAWRHQGLGSDLNARNSVFVGNRGASLAYSDESRNTVFSDLVARNEVTTLWEGASLVVWNHFDGIWADPPATPFGIGGELASTVATWQVTDPQLAGFVDDGLAGDPVAPRLGAPGRDLGFVDDGDLDGSRSDLGACGGPRAARACADYGYDADLDGLGDGWERAVGLDPTAYDADTDADGDGLDATLEYLSGTDPQRADTDLDGVGDGVELGGLGDPTDDRDHRPLAIASEVIQADLGEAVAIDGSGSFDPDLDAITAWRWQVLDAPPGSAVTDASLVGADTATVSFTPDAEGVVRLGLVASAGGADSRQARVWVHVRRQLDVPGEFPTVDDAVDAAAPGDVIALGAGTWPTNFTTDLLPLVFTGAGMDQTFLTAKDADPHFIVTAGADLGLRDLTLMDGANQNGGAINCKDAALALERVRFTHNAADYGGAMYLDTCATTLVDSEFVENASSNTGGAIYSIRGSFDWVGGIAIRNRADYNGGVASWLSTATTIRNVRFHGNVADNIGAAFVIEYYSSEYVGGFDGDHLTITGNDGGLGAVHRLDDFPTTLRNSILAQDTTYAFYDAGSTHAALTLDHNGWFLNQLNSWPTTLATGVTDVKANPQFVDYTTESAAVGPDLHLRANSPMLDLGTDLDPDGTPADFGAYGGPDAGPGWDSYLHDGDADGMADGWELEVGLDPAVDDGAGDLDGDTLSNLTEAGLFSDASLVDSDEDGVDDPTEVANATDPADPDDHAPTAEAGVELDTAVGVQITATGSATDPNGDPITYQWSLVGKPGRSALTDANLVNPTTNKVKITPDSPGVYELQLVTSDGVAFSKPNTTLVHVAGDLEVPADYATVGEAVDAAEDGVVITIGPGVFPAHLDLAGKDLTLIGAGSDLTVLDAEGTGKVLVATSAETVTLQGLTLTRGFGGRGGAAWTQGGGDLTLDDVVLSDSLAAQGGGLYFDDSGTLLGTDVKFLDNYAGYRAAGLYSSGGATIDLLHALFAGNQAPDGQGGAIRMFLGTLTVANSVFSDNLSSEGAGAYLSGTALTATFDHVTATFNSADTLSTSDGAFLRLGSAVSATVTDALVVGNHGPSTIAEYSDTTATVIRYTLFSGNDINFDLLPSPIPVDGVDGVDLDGLPDLAYATDDDDWTNDDWSLGALSDAIDAGDPAGTLDPDGSAPDLGAFGGVDGDWVP